MKGPPGCKNVQSTTKWIAILHGVCVYRFQFIFINELIFFAILQIFYAGLLHPVSHRVIRSAHSLYHGPSKSRCKGGPIHQPD